jgi:hypothetical protein
MFFRITLLTLFTFNIFAQSSPAKISTLSSGIGSSTYMQSIDGLRVWSAEIAANLSEVQLLDLDRLRTGKYILRLVSGNQVITKQLIKE